MFEGLLGTRKKLKFSYTVEMTDKGWENLSKVNPLGNRILECITDSSTTVGRIVSEIQKEDSHISTRAIVKTIEHLDRKGFVSIRDLPVSTRSNYQ